MPLFIFNLTSRSASSPNFGIGTLFLRGDGESRMSEVDWKKSLKNAVAENFSINNLEFEDGEIHYAVSFLSREIAWFIRKADAETFIRTFPKSKSEMKRLSILQGNMPPATSHEVKAVRDITGCGMTIAKEALERRENLIEFAVEYIKRQGLAIVCTEETRFPRWTAFLKARDER